MPREFAHLCPLWGSLKTSATSCAKARFSILRQSVT